MQRRAFLLGAGAAALVGVPGLANAAVPTIVASGGGAMSAANAQELVSLAPNGRVLLSPYSGPSAKVAAEEGRNLRSWGFRHVDVLNLSDPEQARAQIAAAGMIWFAGGSQKSQVLSLSAAPEVMTALHRAYQAGTVMAGGSAGAAVMSRLMISGGTNGLVYTRAGLGFWPEAVIDQHVRARHREYRLPKVIAQNPALVGIGLDEGCMIVFRDGRFTVSGSPFAIVTRSVGGNLTQLELRPGQSYDMGRHQIV